MIPHNPVTPIYYHLPKVHTSTTNPPGRPIIAGIGSLTSPLSEYIDFFLQKYVVKLDSYLKDSATLILLLKPITWQPDYWWASLDVTALYSNIKHEHGISAVKTFLDNDPDMPSSQQKFILDGIRFILTHNIFKFTDQLFIQRCGTAMETKFAPSYANLFMGKFEKTMIMDSKWSDDDLFFIWKGDKSDFDYFLIHLNSNDWGLSFTGTITRNKLEHLDIELTTNNNCISPQRLSLNRSTVIVYLIIKALITKSGC